MKWSVEEEGLVCSRKSHVNHKAGRWQEGQLSILTTSALFLQTIIWDSFSPVCPPIGFYLISPSEFERFSLSARWLVEPRCLVELPDIPTSQADPSRTSLGDGHGYDGRSVLFILHFRCISHLKCQSCIGCTVYACVWVCQFISKCLFVYLFHWPLRRSHLCVCHCRGVRVTDGEKDILFWAAVSWHPISRICMAKCFTCFAYAKRHQLIFIIRTDTNIFMCLIWVYFKLGTNFVVWGIRPAISFSLLEGKT